MPSRDRWPLLRTAIACALAQEGVDVRVIVVDDGSSDQTAAELAALRDARVVTLRNERAAGVSAARNAGLELVTAPWVSFLDDDDVWAPWHLATLLRAIRACDQPPGRVGLAFCGHVTVDYRREVMDVSPAEPLAAIGERMHQFNLIGSPSRVLLRSDAVRAAGAFDVRLSIIADWDLWVRVLARHAAARSSDLTVGYMRHAGNMHHDADRLLDELDALSSKHDWSPDGLSHAVAGDMLPLYIAEAYRAGGRRWRAARWYLRSARARRAKRDVARAGAVLAGEAVVRASGLRRRPAPDPALGRWLEPIRAAERATTTGLPKLPGVHLDRAAMAR